MFYLFVVVRSVGVIWFRQGSCGLFVLFCEQVRVVLFVVVVCCCCMFLSGVSRLYFSVLDGQFCMYRLQLVQCLGLILMVQFLVLIVIVLCGQVFMYMVQFFIVCWLSRYLGWVQWGMRLFILLSWFRMLCSMRVSMWFSIGWYKEQDYEVIGL